MMLMKKFLLGLLLLAPTLLQAQVNPDPAYHNTIFLESIETVSLHRAGMVSSTPILYLNEQAHLELSFDDLGYNAENYQYTLIHCNYLWYPSPIMLMDYLSGVTEGYIYEVKQSFNTLVPYQHYTLRFPNETMQPVLPGNYILWVYRNNDPKDLVLSRRFFVVDRQVQVVGDVHRPLDPRARNEMQEVDFEVELNDIQVSNPYNDIKIMIQQNMRWDNMVLNLAPQFVHGQTLIYDYERENLFEAGSEWRPLDLRSVYSLGVGVDKMIRDSLFIALLEVDEDRSYFTYSFRRDINGNRIIAVQGTENGAIEGDYVKTIFRLKNPYPSEELEVYVFGELSNWQLQPRFRMEYDATKDIYYTDALLKQGYYNYYYVVKRPDEPAAEVRYFEGSHYETENDYTIYVYYRPLSLQTDLLIGLSRLNTVVE